MTVDFKRYTRLSFTKYGPRTGKTLLKTSFDKFEWVHSYGTIPIKLIRKEKVSFCRLIIKKEKKKRNNNYPDK